MYKTVQESDFLSACSLQTRGHGLLTFFFISYRLGLGVLDILFLTRSSVCCQVRGSSKIAWMPSSSIPVSSTPMMTREV
jgi:hypothetical protein